MILVLFRIRSRFCTTISTAKNPRMSPKESHRKTCPRPQTGHESPALNVPLLSKISQTNYSLRPILKIFVRFQFHIFCLSVSLFTERFRWWWEESGPSSFVWRSENRVWHVNRCRGECRKGETAFTCGEQWDLAHGSSPWCVRKPSDNHQNLWIIRSLVKFFMSNFDGHI